MSFFELRTARNLLQKAKREHNRLTQCFDIDNVFNFFVTAYHISDYIRQTKAISKATLNTFLQDQDIKDSRDLCNKGKHLILTHSPDPTTRIYSGAMGGAPMNTLPMGSHDKWVLKTAGREVDVMELSKRVIQKWETFLSSNGL